MGIEFNRVSGGSVDQLIVELKARIATTQEDMLAVGNVVKSGIRERTARGVDTEGDSFAPYSKSGPYYYNPSTGGGKFKAPHESVQKKTATRIHGLLKKRGSEATLSKSGTSIRFENYGAFKAAFGRGGIVDLLGVDAPHMLDAIQVEATANSAVISISGETAIRANAHNRGGGRMPVRQFFKIATTDAGIILALLKERLLARLR